MTDFQYQNNYLKEVIIRVDFAQPSNKVKFDLPKEFTKEAMTIFPLFDPQQTIRKSIKISHDPKNTLTTEEEKSNLWNFYDRNRENHLFLNWECLFISYKKYYGFITLKQNFQKVIESLFNIDTDVQIKRIGLRYINVIELNEAKPFNWNKYINKNLIGIFNFYQNREQISRAFNVLELNYESSNLRFQYGMNNPDFPAVIKRKHFVLDYDAYYNGLIQESSEIESYLNEFYQNIHELFENSITDRLREMMK